MLVITRPLALKKSDCPPGVAPGGKSFVNIKNRVAVTALFVKASYTPGPTTFALSARLAAPLSQWPRKLGPAAATVLRMVALVLLVQIGFKALSVKPKARVWHMTGMPTISGVTGPNMNLLEVSPVTATPFVNHWKKSLLFTKASS